MRPFILGAVFFCVVGIAFQEHMESLENALEYSMGPETSRDSFDARPVMIPNNQPDNEKSTWCSVAMLCKRTMNPVCGYDDSFGYGKFEDICHMLQVNCYWKYNFDLLSSCHPVL